MNAHAPVTAPAGRRRRRLTVTRLLLAVPLAAAPAITLALAAAPRAAAQSANSTITTIVNIPGQVPTGVTGYRVELDCRSVPGFQDGIVAVVTFPATGGTASPQLPLATTTSCRFRLFVLGTGVRTPFGNAVFVGGAPRAISFPTLVNGVTYDANTVVETEAVPITVSTTVVFGAVPTAVTTTTAPTTTAAPTTTTRPPAATAPTTAAPTTAPPRTAPPTTATTAPARRLVRIRGTVYEAYRSSTCRSGVVLYVKGTSRKRCASVSEARFVTRTYPVLTTR